MSWFGEEHVLVFFPKKKKKFEKQQKNILLFNLIRLKVCYVDNFHYWDDSSDQNGNDFWFWGINIGAPKKVETKMKIGSKYRDQKCIFALNI